MLSEDAMGSLQNFMGLCSKYGTLQTIQEMGPAKTLDLILEDDSDVCGHIDRELIANREEAEKYLAGLLGMM